MPDALGGENSYKGVVNQQHPDPLHTPTKVLIVDDMAHVRQNLRTVLPLAVAGKVEIEVVGEAANGQEAVLKAEALHPDVVLMDLEMPIEDGYSATRRVKLICPSVRVVALTIHGESAAQRRAFEAGVDRFVEKSAPLDQLIQALLGISNE
jgi:two-component system response regulator NreC